MDSIKLDWINFKALVDAWSVKSNIRFTPKNESGNYQTIWINFENKQFEVNGGLAANSDEIVDFETNYKPDPEQIWIAGKDVDRNDTAVTFNAQAGQAVQFDLKFEAHTWLWGGDIIIQGTALVDGDSCEVQVVDVDGMYAPAGAVLRTIISKKFVPVERKISVGSPDGNPSPLLAGLYLRFLYTETQNAAKTVDINLVAMS